MILLEFLCVAYFIIDEIIKVCLYFNDCYTFASFITYYFETSVSSYDEQFLALS